MPVVPNVRRLVVRHDQNALRVLLALYRGPAERDIPSEALYMPWQNRRGQLSLLRAAIQAPPQVFTFASSPTKQAPLEDVDPSAATPNGAWLSLDLVAALLLLASDTELYAQVNKRVKFGEHCGGRLKYTLVSKLCRFVCYVGREIVGRLNTCVEVCPAHDVAAILWLTCVVAFFVFPAFNQVAASVTGGDSSESRWLLTKK